MAAKIEFSRDDGNTHFFIIPVSAWQAGGKLIFTAKPVVDDDTTDAAAVIRQEYNDANIISNDGTNVTYQCYFPPSATADVDTQGSDYWEGEGDFQWVSSAGVPTHFPGKSPKMQVFVYADVGRKDT